MDVNQLLESLRRYTNRLKEELTSYVLYKDMEGPKSIQNARSITIEDAAPVNANSVKAKVEPVQDLHGYDYPWVGGAGKNLLPMTVEGIKSTNTSGTWDGNDYTYNGITFTILTDSDGNVTGIKVNGTASAQTSCHIMPATNYSFDTSVILNGCPSGGSHSSFCLMATYYNAYPVWQNEGYDTGNGYTLSSNYAEYDIAILIRNGATVNNLTFYPMIRLATETDSTFAPYTNICSISGWDEVNVQRCGKNLIPYIEQGDWLFDGGTPDGGAGKYVRTPKIKCKPNTSYTASNASGITNKGFVYWDFNGNYVGYNVNTATCTTPANAYYIAVNFSSSNTITPSDVLNPQLELGSTATSYEPYQGKTYTIHLGDNIYGGELDVTKGELMVTKGIVTIQNFGFNADATTSGGLKWQEAELTSALSGSSHSIANLFAYDSSGWWSSIPCYYVRNERVRICTDVHSQAELSEKYADLQIIYDLVTPYTIQLTPKKIKLLENNNTLYADSGDISIEYQPNNIIGRVISTIEDEYDPKPEVVDQYTDVFGFVEDMDVLSTSGRITYIGTNENYTPITVDLSTGHYMLNDWAEFPFLTENKPYMVRPDGTPDYQLNEYDYTKKLDGSASDVANESYNGGAFSFAKKIYSKTWMEGNKRYVLFSFTKKEGFEARGFINPDGSEVDGRWIPMFYGTIVNGVAKSVATGNCITGANITTDAQHDAIVAFDSDAMFFGGSFVEVLNDLMIMFAKNTNTQASYGYGNSSGYNSSLANNGMLDNAVVGGGQFYGTSDAHSLNKIFHSIVLGTYNSWMRDPYEVVRYGEVMVSKDYTYDPTGNTYDDSGVSSPNQSVGWIYPVRYIDVPGYGALPDVVSFSTSTSLARAVRTYVPSNQSSLVVVCLRFGDCSGGVAGGSSARGWIDLAAFTHWYIGFALLLSKSAAA